MALGGPEEQEAERVAGNPNAKNWHDEALKVVEETMHDYWKQVQEELESHPAGAVKPSTSGAFPADESATTLESTFDCHRHELLEKAAHENNDSLGWAAELHRYLGVIIENVSKDMDVIVWWEVCDLVIHTQHTKINNRSMYKYIPPLHALHKMFVQSQHPLCHVNSSFLQGLK